MIYCSSRQLNVTNNKNAYFEINKDDAGYKALKIAIGIYSYI